MKVLVVGCGSIGRRHITNLLANRSIRKVTVCTKVKGCRDIFGRNSGKLEFISDIDSAGDDFELAVISNETYKHIPTALKLAKGKINLFIEKPLSYKLNGVDALIKARDKYRIKVFVGYNLRFLGAIKLLKKYVSSGAIGKLYFSRIECGQYLPLWRNNIDYNDSYSAFKEKGGGVSLDLSHEVDYMRFIFGDPVSWKIAKLKISGLKINSDDLFEGIYCFNKFICSVHLDYLKKEKTRCIFIYGSKGYIRCDIVNKTFEIETDSLFRRLKGGALFDIDKTYADEMDSFISSVRRSIRPAIPLDDGIKAIKLIN